MLTRHWPALIRVLCLVAISFSAALFAHYVAPHDGSFCGAASGCEAVRKSAPRLFGQAYFIPLLGVLGNVGVFWVSFMDARRWLAALGGLGGAIGLALLLHQAWAGTYCWMCVTVDLLALAIAALCIIQARLRAPRVERIRGWSWLALLALAVNTPSAWSQLKPDDALPPGLQRYERAGLVNVFEFVDFQCPHCRRLHPLLRDELERLGARVHFKRFHVPLAFHPQAEMAARANVCAGAHDKEQEMADLLFDTPLREEIWFDHAATLHLDRATFAQCLEAEATTSTLAEHARLFEETSAKGLPLTIVDGQMFEGFPDPALLIQAFDRALEPRGLRLPGWLFLVLLLLVSGALVWGGQRR